MEKQIRLTDQELLNELNVRFDQNTKVFKQLEELNEKLIESEMMKSHFLSNIKNEINNPISSILGLSQGMMTGKKDNEFVVNSSKLIYEETFSLNFQLKNIFCAAEIESGQSQLSIARVNVTELVRTLCDSFQFLMGKKQLKLVLEIDDGLTFKSDLEKLNIIFSNLLSNAIKFSNNDKEVKISANKDLDGNMILIVKDSGVGLDKKNAKLVFDRFKQLEHGTTKQFSGHGLGLSIVSSLVDILGGKIELDSEIRSGCKFTISIPEAENNTNEFSDSDNSFLFFDEDLSDEIF